MTKIIKLEEHRQIKALYSVLVYRAADGSLFASLDWASRDWIETTGDSGSERLRIIANSMPEVQKQLEQRAIEMSQDDDDSDEK